MVVTREGLDLHTLEDRTTKMFRKNVVGVVVLFPWSDPIAAMSNAYERCTRASQWCLLLLGPSSVGGEVGGIRSTMVWCIWWRYFVGGASPTRAGFWGGERAAEIGWRLGLESSVPCARPLYIGQGYGRPALFPPPRRGLWPRRRLPPCLITWGLATWTMGLWHLGPSGLAFPFTGPCGLPW
jgi:hypothetical protein